MPEEFYRGLDQLQKFGFSARVPVPPTAGQGTLGKRSLNKIILVVAIIAVLVVGLLVFVFAASTLNTSTKRFAPFSAPVSQSSTQNSLRIVDVNGAINLIPTSGTTVTVNGTVTARGFAASPDAITFLENSSSSNILFQAIFPSTPSIFFYPSYTVDMNVYFPSQYSTVSKFSSFVVIDTNGNINASTIDSDSIRLATTNGNIRATVGITSSLTITTTSGNVDFACAITCGNATATSMNGGLSGRFQGLFLQGSSNSLITTNGNVAVTLLAASSCKLSANTTNGSISTSGLGLAAQAGTSLNVTLSTGSASLNLKTVNGSISITGV